MLEKQDVPSDCGIIQSFSLEPEVQIKEEKDLLDVSFEEIAIKKEGVDECNEVENKFREQSDFTIEKEEEDFSPDVTQEEEEMEEEEEEEEEEDQENDSSLDLVQKINQDTRSFVKMRWSSLLNKVAKFRVSNLKAEDEKGSFTCNKCLLNFDSETDLLDHEQNHNDAFFRCFECDQVFDRSFSLRVHQAFHGTLKRHKCQICNKSFTRKSSLNDHALSHSGEKPYQCEVCKKYYRSKVSLASHSRYHYKVKKYECPVCKKLFFQPSGLSQHLRIHRNAKDYKCNICSKRFSYGSTLKRHVKSHFETEKHACDECDKNFKQISSLLFHKRSKHLGLKPFKCEDCDKTFTRSWSLKLHMNRHRVLQIQNTIEVVSRR